MKNCFRNDYEAKKLLNEIQFMRQLSTTDKNCFTPHIFDIIFPRDLDVTTTESIPYLFIVMELEQMSLD